MSAPREVLELPVDGSVQVRPIPAEPFDAPANAQGAVIIPDNDTP